MSEATARYDQSSRAAFAMFDLLDVDRSGYITRGDFVHKLIDTDCKLRNACLCCGGVSAWVSKMKSGGGKGGRVGAWGVGTLCGKGWSFCVCVCGGGGGGGGGREQGA